MAALPGCHLKPESQQQLPDLLAKKGTGVLGGHAEECGQKAKGGSASGQPQEPSGAGLLIWCQVPAGKEMKLAEVWVVSRGGLSVGAGRWGGRGRLCPHRSCLQEALQHTLSKPWEKVGSTSLAVPGPSSGQLNLAARTSCSSNLLSRDKLTWPSPAARYRNAAPHPGTSSTPCWHQEHHQLGAKPSPLLPTAPDGLWL